MPLPGSGRSATRRGKSGAGGANEYNRKAGTCQLDGGTTGRSACRRAVRAAPAGGPQRQGGCMAADTCYGVIIIGTGAGGGSLAYHLAPSGKRILLLERGGRRAIRRPRRCR